MADGETVAGAATHALGKFEHPDITAKAERRASVLLDRFETLWVNTGTLCNIECAHCYIHSSPANDRLAYITADELAPFLDEASSMVASEVGFTGGEPFLNPDMLEMAEAALARGFSVLILTNAMRPMMRPAIKAGLRALKESYADKLKIRVSIDHFAAAHHDEERGAGSFDLTLEGIAWLVAERFSISIAGRTRWGEREEELRDGFAALFQTRDIPLNAHDAAALVLFPEMDESAPVPEITENCWDILGKNPADLMCASARMVVKRKGADRPVVLSCTLLAYDPAFELGETLEEASKPVKLNHPHCAKFCVLGGARCSG